MKHINLYFLNDRLFIIPNSVLKNGPLIMSGFPIEIELSVPKIKIGIVDAFNQCGYLNEEPKDNYFNIFFKNIKG